MLQAGRDLPDYLVQPADLIERAGEVVSREMLSPSLHSQLLAAEPGLAREPPNSLASSHGTSGPPASFKREEPF